MKMGQKNCEHEWEEDPMFIGDGVMIFSGKIGEVKRETRVICKLCGEINYFPIEEIRI